MKEGYIPNTSLYYRTNNILAGRENLLFIHGLSGSLSAWKEFEERLGDTYNIYTFDLRGHGKSAKPKQYTDYALPCFADDVSKCVDYFALDQFILISHSFGTFVAFEYLRNHSNKVKAVVFMSPSTNAYRGILPQFLRPLLTLSRMLKLFPIPQRVGDHIDYSVHKQNGDFDLRAVALDVKNTSIGVYLYSTEQSLKVTFDSILKDINVPVLLIHGRLDSILSMKNSLLIQKQLPHSELVIFDNADHIVVRNNAQQASKEIDSFIKKLTHSSL